jgi:hypothetical protein
MIFETNLRFPSKPFSTGVFAAAFGADARTTSAHVAVTFFLPIVTFFGTVLTRPVPVFTTPVAVFQSGPEVLRCLETSPLLVPYSIGDSHSHPSLVYSSPPQGSVVLECMVRCFGVARA